MLSRRFAIVVVGLAGLSLGLGVSTAPVACAATEPTAEPVPLLSVGKSVRGGHWTSQQCTPDQSGMVFLPPVGMLDRHAFTLTKRARVSLTFAADVASGHPAASALVLKLAKFNPAHTFVPPTQVKDSNGQAIMAGINIQAGAADADKPKSHNIIANLSPGTYLTDVTYSYCTGFFRVTLDSVTPLPQTPPPSVKAVKLYRKSLKLTVGKKFQLHVRVVPKAATGAKLTWKSSNPKVAKVSKAGRVRAVKAGRATITVKAPTGTKAKLKVKVKAKAKAKVK